MDGLGIVASQQGPAHGLAATVVAGVTLHKIPEGIALGIMLRARGQLALRRVRLVCRRGGGYHPGAAVLELALSDRLGVHWVAYPLALAGGSFLFLGFLCRCMGVARGAPALCPH